MIIEVGFDYVGVKNVVNFSRNQKRVAMIDKKIKEKCIRIFASKYIDDPGVAKVSERTGKPAKISNSPEHCFIYNDEVNDVKVPNKLDKSWYINLANKRLNDFGVI